MPAHASSPRARRPSARSSRPRTLAELARRTSSTWRPSRPGRGGRPGARAGRAGARDGLALPAGRSALRRTRNGVPHGEGERSGWRSSRSRVARRRRHRGRSLGARVHGRQASAMTLAAACRSPRRLDDPGLDAPPQPRDRVRRRPLARDRVLDVQGRAAPDRGPVARRARDGARLRPAFHRARSSTCSSVRPSTSRTCTSASSRSRRWSSGSRSSTGAAPSAGRASSRLPRLPGLHDAPEAGVRDLRPAARRALAGVPALREPTIAPRLPALEDVTRAGLPAPRRGS